MTVEGVPMELGTMKQAHDRDGIVLRIYEPHGKRGTSHLTFDRPLTNVDRTNLLEEDVDGGEITINDATLHIDVRPFEVITLLLQFA